MAGQMVGFFPTNNRNELIVLGVYIEISNLYSQLFSLRFRIFVRVFALGVKGKACLSVGELFGIWRV